MSAKRLYLGFTLIAMIGIPASVQAEDDYGRQGFYLGAGLGLGFEQFEDTGGADIDTGIGFDAWAGYRMTPNFAAELQIEYIDRFDITGVEGNVLAFTGNLKGYLSTGWLQPFAVVGVGVLRAEVDVAGLGSFSDSDLAARFGGGVDCYLSPNMSLGATASYVLTTGDVDGFDYVSLVLAFQYRF